MDLSGDKASIEMAYASSDPLPFTELCGTSTTTAAPPPAAKDKDDLGAALRDASERVKRAQFDLPQQEATLMGALRPLAVSKRIESAIFFDLLVRTTLDLRFGPIAAAENIENFTLQKSKDLGEFDSHILPFDNMLNTSKVFDGFANEIKLAGPPLQKPSSQPTLRRREMDSNFYYADVMNLAVALAVVHVRAARALLWPVQALRLDCRVTGEVLRRSIGRRQANGATPNPDPISGGRCKIQKISRCEACAAVTSARSRPG